ncbi:uncharacterized protein NPIL_501171 [Nephila pilipes]|uniref:Uncharacterized protein n=1 Tax=Nephila pilipes TaxID=299642 RepID=A0A8X6PU37_NEPPI|nr:uncharacterized protein NPIL_501171 [Nephila pilipes]
MDLDLCQVYFDAILKLLDKENRRENIKQLRIFLNRFPLTTNSSKGAKSKKGKEWRLWKITSCYRIAYLYRNSTCISSATALHFGDVLKQNLGIVRQMFQKSSILRICSIGGGSPSDLVALVKILGQNLGNRMSCDIHVTIVDMDENWITTCTTVLQCLEWFRNAEWKIRFVHADVTEMNEEVKNSIKKANIVSIVKFMSECKGGTKKKKLDFKKNLFQKVHDLMETGSLLFLLDCPHNGLSDICGGQSGLLPDSQLLYDVNHQSHKLDKVALQKHAKQYEKLFRSALRYNTLEVFCRAWLKAVDSPPTDGVFLKVLRDRYEGFRNCLAKINIQSSHHRHSDDASAKGWKQFFVAEMKNIGWNRKKIKRALASVEREVLQMYKK